MTLCAPLNWLIRQNTRGVCIRSAMILLPSGWTLLLLGLTNTKVFWLVCLLVCFASHLQIFNRSSSPPESGCRFLSDLILHYAPACVPRHSPVDEAVFVGDPAVVTVIVNCKYQLFWNKDAIKGNSKALLPLLCWRVKRTASPGSNLQSRWLRKTVVLSNHWGPRWNKK